mmetsp:Transcript_28033/g.77114  ORF Transcript_28033/g.77114 Transcript_28033/m.77114 type:complete len:209 (+) Transcript_28033:13-639(+)
MKLDPAPVPLPLAAPRACMQESGSAAALGASEERGKGRGTTRHALQPPPLRSHVQTDALPASGLSLRKALQTKQSPLRSSSDLSPIWVLLGPLTSTILNSLQVWHSSTMALTSRRVPLTSMMLSPSASGKSGLRMFHLSATPPLTPMMGNVTRSCLKSTSKPSFSPSILLSSTVYVPPPDCRLRAEEVALSAVARGIDGAYIPRGPSS